MMSLEELWPPFTLRVACGDVALRAVRDEDLPALVELALAGVHPPDQMPFTVPWTDGSPGELGRRSCQYHWGVRAEFEPGRWRLELVVEQAGEIVGVQGIGAEQFLVTRTGETGSWLGQRFQGRGIGTRMRQAVCVLAFDHLDFAELTSAAFVDNQPSLAVSRKVGYLDNGEVRLPRRDTVAVQRRLVLTPETFVRPAEPVEVTGVEPLQTFIGLT